MEENGGRQLATGREKEAPIILYVFADPFCPYCLQFWQQARPWVESGKVQIRTLLVGVIKPESPATAAAILATQDPAKTGVITNNPPVKCLLSSRLISPRKNEDRQRESAANG